MQLLNRAAGSLCRRESPRDDPTLSSVHFPTASAMGQTTRQGWHNSNNSVKLHPRILRSSLWAPSIYGEDQIHESIQETRVSGACHRDGNAFSRPGPGKET